jgi:hypothetical protein
VSKSMNTIKSQDDFRNALIAEISDERKANIRSKLAISVATLVANFETIKQLDCVDEIVALMKHDEKTIDYAARLVANRRAKKINETLSILKRLKAKSMTRDSFVKKLSDLATCTLATANRQSFMTLNALRAVRAVNVDTSVIAHKCEISKCENFEHFAEMQF